MKSSAHFVNFLLLGLFWGVSPSIYKHLSAIGMSPLHTIFFTGIAVGLIMLALAAWKAGTGSFDKRLVRYGLGCAALMNLPFGLNLYLAGSVPPTELAIIITLSPFFSYVAAVLLRHERAGPRKLVAISLGFLSTLVLILSRGGTFAGAISWPLVQSILIPLLYCGYNTFAARAWPAGADTLQAGAFESLWSGLIILPFLLWYAPLGAPDNPDSWQYWVLGIVSLMWVVERIVYFTLITKKGAVYTVQATYVSTPAAVIIGAVFFGGGTDLWLWVALAVLMLALYFNNTSTQEHALPPTNPESHPV